jgi:hypothetical protein
MDALSTRVDNGPKIFLSYDSAAEKLAIHNAFPQPNCLCIFRVLRAIRRYLWDSSRGVSPCQRKLLYSKVKDMLY